MMMMRVRVLVLMPMLVLVLGRGLDDALRVVDDGLQRVGLAGDDKFDTPLRHASAKALTRTAGDERVDAVDRMLVTMELVK